MNTGVVIIRMIIIIIIAGEQSAWLSDEVLLKQGQEELANVWSKTTPTNFHIQRFVICILNKRAREQNGLEERYQKRAEF